MSSSRISSTTVKLSGVENSFYKLVPGCEGMPHVTIKDAGHFLQEDQPDACVEAILSIKDI